jgi:hypothetical protein
LAHGAGDQVGFLTNQADEAFDIILLGLMTNLLTGSKVKEQMTLEAKRVMILR